MNGSLAVRIGAALRAALVAAALALAVVVVPWSGSHPVASGGLGEVVAVGGVTAPATTPGREGSRD